MERDTSDSIMGKLAEWFSIQDIGTEFTIEELALKFGTTVPTMSAAINTYFVHRFDVDQKDRKKKTTVKHDGLPDPLSPNDVPFREGIDPRKYLNILTRK